MPTGNISWGDMAKGVENRLRKGKARANKMAEPQRNEGITNAGVVPGELSRPSGKTSNAFGSIKAYYTRASRSVHSRK